VEWQVPRLALTNECLGVTVRFGGGWAARWKIRRGEEGTHAASYRSEVDGVNWLGGELMAEDSGVREKEKE